MHPNLSTSRITAAAVKPPLSIRVRPVRSCCSLLARRNLLLGRDDLAKHHHAVAVKESDPRQALAVLERVHNERLLRRERALSHLVRLHRVPIFQRIFETRHAARPHRTKPIGEYPILISPGMSRTWIWYLPIFHKIFDTRHAAC